MKTKLVNAIVLSRKDFGEADRLLLMFTKELGKIKVISRGSRRIKSRLACHLEPFTQGIYYLIEGKNNYILAGAETTCSSDCVTKNLSLYSQIAYASEVLNMVLPEEAPNERLFESASSLYELIMSSTEDERLKYLNYLLYSTLKHSGFGPDLYHCANCHLKFSEAKHFSGKLGAITCIDCNNNAKIELHLLKYFRLVDNENLDDFRRLKTTPALDQDAFGMLEDFLCDILPRKTVSLRN